MCVLQDDRTADIVPGGFDLENSRGLVPSNTYLPRRRCDDRAGSCVKAGSRQDRVSII